MSQLTAASSISVSMQGQSVAITKIQDVVSFSTYFSSPVIAQLKREGYRGLPPADQLQRLIQDQSYAEVLKYIWTEDNLDSILQALEPLANAGHAILMLEMSRTMCRKMQAQNDFSAEKIGTASKWYTLGMATTQLDLACNTDLSTTAALGMLHSTYHCSLHIPPAELSKINAKEIASTIFQNWKLLPAYPSPKWVTYHGLRAFSNQNSLHPESEWNQRRAEEYERIQKKVRS
jgi:hypothetical protein